MKIALIRRQFAATGGAELYLQRLIKALAEGGHEVHLFAEKWEGAPEAVKLHPVPVKAVRAQRPVVFAEAVARQVKAEPFDVVFSLERTVTQDVYRAGDGLHRVWLEQRQRYASWWRRPFVGSGAFHRNMMALEARTFDPRNTRHVIVNSNMVKDEILRHFQFPEERIHLVRNGVNVRRFRSGDRAEVRRRFGLRAEDYVLLFVGSGWERKGLPFLLRLMKRYESSQPGVKLLVVGKGRRQGKTPANIVYGGSMPDVENAYAAADLLTFLPIYEPSSNVVSESLAAGLPVITSRFNGASELIEARINGQVLDEPSDTDLLERAVNDWRGRGPVRVPAGKTPLDLERNVRETLAVLELAARERAAAR
ncbi:MAG TPA: glycosyltransferase family 4 protein [Prosthecobacter sp.]|nr:glycosyltransferase family 4 protein [Prosthecobacter sp.]